jgi:hypothetical protein
MGRLLCAALCCALICLAAGAASADEMPIGLNWSEQVNLAVDSGGVSLDSNATATVIWDADGSGLAAWSVGNPIPSGDQIVVDIHDAAMTAPFGNGPFLGQFLGSWTADDNDPWTQDGEGLYLLAFVPAAFSSSGLDEYGISELIMIADWPNKSPVSHDIVGGGPIATAPVPEPATLLLAAGGLGLLLFRKKR